jgi:hypothetical protein
MFAQIRKTISLTMITMTCATALSAQDAASSQQDVLLTVSGAVDTATAEGLTFDREDLMALPVTTIETSTIWDDGIHSFTGVALSDLIDLLGVDSGTLLATAINDYTVEIPVTDAVEGGPIIAYLMDDAEMQVRDKGPLWIVYNYDSSAEYRSEVIYSRSIWQLDRIEVER